jgi:hypothetical protein
MDTLTQLEWIVVLGLGISGSITLNYESMSRRHGFSIGSMFTGANFLTAYSFFSVIAPIIFAVIYGKWWYGLIIFFGGLSIGAGGLILMFREKSQILSLLGMGGFSLMFGYVLILRIG